MKAGREDGERSEEEGIGHSEACPQIPNSLAGEEFWYWRDDAKIGMPTQCYLLDVVYCSAH